MGFELAAHISGTWTYMHNGKYFRTMEFQLSQRLNQGCRVKAINLPPFADRVKEKPGDVGESWVQLHLMGVKLVQ